MKPSSSVTLGAFAIKWPKTWLLAIALATAFFASGLGRLEVRTDGASLLPADNATVLQSLADSELFREADRVVILLTSSEDGPAIASEQGLRVLRNLHSELAELEGVVADKVRSLTTLMDPSPGMSIVLIGNMLDEIPNDEASLADLMQRVSDSPHGRGLFLSEDGRAAAVYVPLVADIDHALFVERITGWIKEHTPPDFDLQLTGPIVAEVTLGQVVVEDLAKLVPIVVLVIALLLFVTLGSIGSLCVAMAEVGIVLVWTLGAMGITGTPVTLVTTILPIVLLTMAVSDEIHLLDRVRAHLHTGQNPRTAIAHAMQDVARPIVLTSLTTSLSLLSFALTSLVPLQHFGIFAAAGVMLAMLLSFTLVPALVVVLPASLFKPLLPSRQASSKGRQLRGFFGARSALLGCLLVALALPGLAHIEVSDSWIDNLESDSELVVATQEFDESFWGSYRYDIVLSSDERAFFQFPTGLGVIERVVKILRAAPHVGGIVSHLDAHEVHAMVDSEPLPVSALPFEKVRRFSGNLMKIQLRVDLANYLTSNGRSARIRMLIPDANFARTRELEDYLGRELPLALEGTGVTSHHSGDLPSAQAAVGTVVMNVIQSTGWSILGVALILMVALRSARSAIICMVPLLSGLALLIAAMGWLEIPLGIATGMVAALTIGVGIDFGLHAHHAYIRARAAGEGHREALDSVLVQAGRPILWNTITLAVGLFVLGLSSLPPNRRLGILLSSSMVLSCAMCLVFLPWLLSRVPSQDKEWR